MIGTITRRSNVLTGCYPPDKQVINPVTGNPAFAWRAVVQEGRYETMRTALEVAQLFEAAPDLLAAVREAQAWMTKAADDDWLNDGGWAELPAVREKLDAALAKAEGRS